VKVVGRARELAAARSWLAAETGRLVLCGGEPGIGKTRLAQELAGHALALGREVVWGHCVETEGAPAFWPWRQVLKAAGADPDRVLAHDAEVPQDRFRVFARPHQARLQHPQPDRGVDEYRTEYSGGWLTSANFLPWEPHRPRRPPCGSPSRPRPPSPSTSSTR
jgi:hypothetical protein